MFTRKNEMQESAWQQEALERIALAGLIEQRRSRRWSIFFRLLGLACFLLLFWAISGPEASLGELREAGQHTALIRLEGALMTDAPASAQRINAALRAAFADRGTQAIILDINSPGGSPVQAGQIFDEIRRLRVLHPKIPVYAVVEDYCASGGYYVAAAADRIYVDKASMLGSIGVIMEGFGFTGSMEKLGVERRLLTAGENKGFLDPFSATDAKQQDHAKQMLEEIHRQFIDAVKTGRGERLKFQENPEIFSGLMWTGVRSIALGLADALGSVESVAREVIKVENLRDYTMEPSLADRLTGRFGRLGAETLAAVWNRLETLQATHHLR